MANPHPVGSDDYYFYVARAGRLLDAADEYAEASRLRLLVVEACDEIPYDCDEAEDERYNILSGWVNTAAMRVRIANAALTYEALNAG